MCRGPFHTLIWRGGRVCCICMELEAALGVVVCMGLELEAALGVVMCMGLELEAALGVVVCMSLVSKDISTLAIASQINLH